MFEVTRRIVDELDDWVNILAASALPLTKKPGPEDSFFWRLRHENAEGLLIAKAVRIASGFRAALLLVEVRHVTEAQSLLRLVSDFTAETIAVGEGVARGGLSKSQREFVRQFYAQLPANPDEFAMREKEYYVSRAELFKAHRRLLEGANIDTDEYERLKRFVDKNYDSYVHGSYDTAMELFHGGTQRFQTQGHVADIVICLTLTSIAGKLYEALIALEFVARLQDNESLAERIHVRGLELVAAGEFMSDYCRQGQPVRNLAV